ncbi:hypothetical protein DV36_36675 [Amycolatopsis mediterranei]|nr:hypothetical protein DV36_36675 [Amycolatopsis mediterranei]
MCYANLASSSLESVPLSPDAEDDTSRESEYRVRANPDELGICAVDAGLLAGSVSQFACRRFGQTLRLTHVFASLLRFDSTATLAMG